MGNHIAEQLTRKKQHIMRIAQEEREREREDKAHLYEGSEASYQNISIIASCSGIICEGGDVCCCLQAVTTTHNKAANSCILRHNWRKDKTSSFMIY